MEPIRCRARRGFSLIELLIVVAVILVIAAIAIPRFLQSKMVANETSAVASLRTIATVEVNYDSTYKQGYSPDLTVLGPPPAGAPPSAAAAGLIDQVLASGVKSGYTFSYSAIDADGDGKPEGFICNANPVSPGQTGNRYFYVDQTNVIRFHLGAPANSASTPVPQQ
jgi:prepilin-type N-terminal cleavage/methylation domain-containing protein